MFQSPQKKLVLHVKGEKKKAAKDVTGRVGGGVGGAVVISDGVGGGVGTRPRNISPKPKENSPKQTLVATAKGQIAHGDIDLRHTRINYTRVAISNR